MPYSRTAGRTLALGLLIAGHGLTSSVVATEKPLEEVQQRIKVTRETREALRTVRDRLDGDLAELERRQGELARRLFELEAQSRDREQRMAELRRKRDPLLVAVRQQQKVLKGQLRSAYAIGRQDWLKLLLNQEQPSHLARVLAYYGYLNQARLALIQSWWADLAALRVTEAQLASESREQAANQQALALERAAVVKASGARRQLLTGWDAALKGEDARLAQLKEDQERLQALLQSVQAAEATPPVEAPPPPASSPQPVTAARKARCPPAGTVLAQFGSPRMTGRWDGMLIGGREGSSVRAVAPGHVVFADWFRGYGLLMIVDQGAGIMSLYAFNQTLYKHKGDAVSADEVIAAVGVSGGRDKPGLYFGIREQGKPVDPRTWCASRP